MAPFADHANLVILSRAVLRRARKHRLREEHGTLRAEWPRRRHPGEREGEQEVPLGAARAFMEETRSRP